MPELGADGPIQELSSLAKLLDSRERKLHAFDAAAVLESSLPGAFFVRVPTAHEEIDAQIWAARFRARELGESADVEKACNATLETLHVVANACLRREKSGDLLPAFGPPLWMAKRLKSDDIARLLELVNEARIRERGAERYVSPEMVGDLVTSLAECSESEAAEVCMGLSRDELVQVARHMAAMVHGLVTSGIEAGHADD